VIQLAHIERRQARIRRIRQRLSKSPPKTETVLQDPDSKYCIGIDEKLPQDIGTFLRSHAGDPAIEVRRMILLKPFQLNLCQGFWPKLKLHVLPRIKEMIKAERQDQQEIPSAPPPENLDALELAGVHFKGERMYRHNIMRINYTTYDVRRAQDCINPRTNLRDIMLLSHSDDDSARHEFEYARVIGIYHVNVVYTGPGMLDYRARRVTFLWVRWYEILKDIPAQQGWENAQLDCLQFPPMSEADSFGFVDPADVLRGSHIIPSFSVGPRHTEAVGVSECARNSQDWRQYIVNR
jgi:hypothetical protein